MKNRFGKLALTTAIAASMLPALAAARPVTLTTTLKNYGGGGAYLVLYVTDAKGVYQGTLWMAGTHGKFYRYLKQWFRATRGNLAEVNGITGASVGSGRSFSIKLDLSDALFDAGYKLHIDAAAENFRESPSDVVVPLTKAGAGKPVRGRAFVKSFTYSM